MEYTLVYVVDEDQLSNMYLHFYPQNEIEINGEYLTTPYVDNQPVKKADRNLNERFR